MNKNRKEDKRNEAIQRQNARNDRTDEQQIDKLNDEGWSAIKERERLQNRIEKETKEQFSSLYPFLLKGW